MSTGFTVTAGWEQTVREAEAEIAALPHPLEATQR
jgi:hypothetical protein